MLIPGVPVKGAKNFRLNWQERLLKPFPFLLEKQVLFSCGRKALYFGLKLLKDLPETAHIPAYCCKSVLVPFKKLGIKINFYDIGHQLEPIVNNVTFREGDLFLLIHYFGIPQNVQSIKQLCVQKGLILVEDCAHGLPDPESKCPMGSIGSFSIYSLRKQLPVPDGGVLVINDDNLKDCLNVLPNPRLRNISIKKRLAMALDRIAFSLGQPNTLKIKDFLRDKIGSTEIAFYSKFADEPIPEVSYATAKFLTNADFSKIVEIRKKNYYWLVEKLKKYNKLKIPFPELPDGAVPQGLPILIKNADDICTSMRKKGIGVDRWPANEFPQIEKEKFPNASYWNEHLVLLPIHQDLSSRHLEFCAKVLVSWAGKNPGF